MFGLRQQVTHEWTPAQRIMAVPLVDGTRGSGWLMKRVVKGQYQFRKMTDDEMSDVQDRVAW